MFEEAWALVRDRYVYTDYRGLDWNAVHDEFAPRVAAAPSEEAFYDLMYELIARLDDDHSYFASPQEVARGDAAFEGTLNYAGIGVRAREVDNGVLITAVAKEGPAAEAGLQPREIITAINGVLISPTDIDPMDGIRGVPGTPVELTIVASDGSQRTVTIIRRVIPSDAFPDVEATRLSGTNDGFLYIGTFYQSNVDALIRAQLEQLLAAGPIDRLVIDVRSNGGGRVDYLLNTLGLFIDGGTIGTTTGRDHSDTLRIPEGTALPQLEGVPIAVLIGPDTVSAAEMFAAGMQIHGRATIVGTPSMGNTENLIVHTLSDGSELSLAIMAYRLPDGSLIEGHGVQPDHTIDAEWWRYNLEDDPLVRAALEHLP